MTSIALLWVLSILGAVLFAVGGWLLSRALGPARIPDPGSQTPVEEADQSNLLHQLEQAFSNAEDLKRNLSVESDRSAAAEAQVQQALVEFADLKGALATESELRKAAEDRVILGQEKLEEQRRRGEELEARLEQEQIRPELDKATADLKRAQARLASQTRQYKQLEEQLRKRLVKDKSQQEEMHTLRERLDGQRARVSEMEQSDEGLQEEVAELKARLAVADGKAARTEELEERLFSLRQESKVLQAQVGEGKVIESMEAERADLVMELRALKQRDEERIELADEKMKLAEQLRDARQSMESLQERMEPLLGAEADRNELSVRVTLQQERLDELERIRADQRALRDRTNDYEAQEAELARIRQENARLRSMGLVQKTSRELNVTGDSKGLGGSLNSLLEGLSNQEVVRGAAFADRAGLPVAGVGKYTDSLAAVAATFMDRAVRLQGGDVLPLSQVRQLTISDENKLTLGVQPIVASGEKLLLATLTAGRALEPDEINDLIQQEPGEASGE